ncbi:MAG TPA: porphobilinogen synthase [Verrucomicrobiales bacterium]|nr:porphobilinogen synthase [Verrucomicrobiales bacterium]
MKPLPIRPRRNRRSEALRGLCRETVLRPEDLIYPLFVHESDRDETIAAMPGCLRWSPAGLLDVVGRAAGVGIGAVALFPKVEESLKSPGGEESCNPAGLIPQAARSIKERFPEVAVITDVALDPYSSEGHDGIVERGPRGEIRVLNDETVEALCRQALCQARAGADLVAPSDMMDGRVAAIRAALDAEGFSETGILAYAAKYASAFYGPFRGALESAPKEGDKKSYQMDPANAREALREAELDAREGADILLVKPAGAYLDVIWRIRQVARLPIAAYQVSGEYLMIRAAAAAGWLDEKAAIEESLIAIKRAGADMIVSYFALEAAERLR